MHDLNQTARRQWPILMLLALLLLNLSPVARGQAITVHSPAPGAPISFLWPKAEATRMHEGLLPVVSGGRPTQVDVLPGKYLRICTRAAVAGVEEIRLVHGLPATTPPPSFPDPLLGFSARLIGADGRDLYQAGPVEYAVAQNGPLYQAGTITTPNVVQFVEWYPDLRAGSVRIVLRNGIVDTSGVVPAQDLRGRLEIRYGARLLRSEADVSHGFGGISTYRFAVGYGTSDGQKLAVSLERAPFPRAVPVLPLDVFQRAGLLPTWHPSTREALTRDAAPVLRWPLAFAETVSWPRGGASAGGNPVLAPFPRHDVAALLDPVAHLARAEAATIRWPYPMVFTDAEGRPITPQEYPQGWLDVMVRPRGITLRDFGGVQIGDIARPTYTTDAAHLPNPCVAMAILTGDPFPRALSEWIALGSVMSSRGLSGRGWRRYGRADGPIVSPPSPGVIHGRGPTGAEGWWGSQERAGGWGPWQLAHAMELTGSPALVHLAVTHLQILRGHYLDAEIPGGEPASDDVARWWGAYCRPWWYEAVWGGPDAPGIPPVPMLSDGSSAYVSPINAINPETCSAAHALWQSAFQAMAIGKLHGAFAAFPSMRWTGELLDYAVGQHLRLESQGIAWSSYCVPVRGVGGEWLTSPAGITDGWLTPAQASVLDNPQARSRDIIDGVSSQHGGSYIAFNLPAFVAAARLPQNRPTATALEARLDAAGWYERFPPEWRVVLAK